MKRISFIVLLILCISLVGCGSSEEVVESSNTLPTATPESVVVEDTPKPTPTPDPVLFKSDKVVNKFFVDYNNIAEYLIPVEEIEEGNIRTKALVYIDDLNLEIINAKDFLSVSIETAEENIDTKMAAIYRDAIKVMRPELADDEILNSWNEIGLPRGYKSGHNFNDIEITFVPTVPRIDLKFPLK